MSSYVEQTQTRGERVLLETRIALRAYWGRFLVVAVIALPGISALFTGEFKITFYCSLLSLILLASPLIRYLTNELALTNRRVVAKVGWLSLKTVEIQLAKIESLRVDQSIFGRLFGYGTIVIVGTGGTSEPIPSIPNPVAFRMNFNGAMETVGAHHSFPSAQPSFGR